MINIYLDNNSTTQADPEVIEAMLAELKGPPSNPSSIHQYGQRAKYKLEEARRSIAHFFSASADEIIFTSGGTESINLAIRGMELPPHKNHIISSEIEHASVLSTLADMEKIGYEVSYLPASKTGQVNTKELKKTVKDNTAMIVLSAANTETGVKNNVNEIANIAEEHDLVFILDAIALIGKSPFKLHPAISAIAVSGHKIHGPKGIGLLYLSQKCRLRSEITGGSQEKNHRAGTENLTGIIGLAKAFEIMQIKLLENQSYINHLRDRFESLIQNRLPGVQVNGTGPRVCNTSSLFFPNLGGETLMIQLDLQAIAASMGSACSSGSLEPSKVITAMYNTERAKSSLRFSFSKYNTEKEVDTAADIICALVEELQALHV